MKQILSRMRDCLNELEAELSKQGSGSLVNAYDPLLHDEREAHAETKRKLELTQVEVKELRKRRTPQPDIINEAPEIDHGASTKVETEKRDVEIRRLRREVGSLQKQRDSARTDIKNLGIELDLSMKEYDKVTKELVEHRKANYPVVIEKLEAEVRELKTQCNAMLGTIREQRAMINKLEVRND